MRHRQKLRKLARPADQRKAMIRSLATSLFMHDEIMTTHIRAKALREYAEKIVTLSKRGPQDVHAIRQVARLIYNQPTGAVISDEDGSKQRPETVLRRIFNTVGKRYVNRNGGCIRIIQAPPRRGDAAPMALIQLLDA